MADLRPVVAIVGTLELTDGTAHSFQITPGGWQQWGADTPRLGACVDLLEAVAAAAADFMPTETEEA